MTNLALFDFDGTITDSDSFTPFLYKAIPHDKIKAQKILLAPYILGYKLKLISGKTLRSKIFKIGFTGCDALLLKHLGYGYSQTYLPTIVRPHALERIHWHLSQKDHVVVVSASMDVYLRPWCEQYGLALICSEIEEVHGVITGIYKHGDCSGATKKQRILANYDLSQYQAIYAYGDSLEDQDMLSLATYAFYQWQPINP